MWTASDGKHFFGASDDLADYGHMSGLLVRSLCPLALMRSDDRDSHQKCELCAPYDCRVFLVLGGSRCRSSRLFALAKLESAKSPLNASPDPPPRRGRAGAARERALHSAVSRASGSSHAFANVSARKPSPVFIIAQTIRANLLANATVTSRAGFLANSATIQSYVDGL